MNKGIEECAEVVEQMVEDDKARDELYQKIDDARNCVFVPSSEVQQLPWVQDRHYGMTQVADAINTGARTFSTLLPGIEIMPNTEDEREYQRVEMAEQIWEWEFKRMNRVQSKKPLHDRVLESAVSYHSVAMQTSYLPYMFKGREKTNKVKALLAHKNFSWETHHPGTVHNQTGECDTLERVTKVVTMTAQELIDYFGEDNKGVKKLRSERDKDSKADLMKAKYTLVDYMDWEYRRKWAFEGEGKIVGSDIVFMDEEHKLPFIPWIVIDYGDPLWKSVIQSGLWENFQYANMIIFAKALEQSTRSTLVIKTPDGTLQNIWIDFSNISNPIVIPQGSEITNLNPPPIDPQLTNVFQNMYNQISASTVSQVLTNIGQYENAPFSTVERIVQLALGQLAPARKAAESAEAEGIFQGFQWIRHSGIPMVGYRANTSDSKTGGEAKPKGQRLTIWPTDPPAPEEIAQMSPELQAELPQRVYFDTEFLYINVNLKSNNVADEQAQINMMINMTDRLGLSRRSANEKLGYKNFDLEQAHRAEEILFEAEIQKQVQMGQAEVQLMMMQQQAQIQQQQQQAQMEQEMSLQAQQNEMNAGSQFASVQGQDMRSGGQPAAQSAPFATREQVTGQTRQGGEMV